MLDKRHGLFVVADGVGGHEGGDAASRLAVGQLPVILFEHINAHPAPTSDHDPAIPDGLKASVRKLNRYVHDWGREAPEIGGVGTTVVAALLTGRRAFIANMGDSRAYFLRDETFKLLTQDHSLVQMLLRNGEITEEEAEDHPAKGQLTRFIGMEADIEPDICAVDLLPGDRLLLCTDGLWGMLSWLKMKTILIQRADPETTCERLVEAGLNAGGLDNLTAVVIDVGLNALVNQACGNIAVSVESL
jgi:PPM family protein phosphatase